jgi:CheY-like chemotaxis protein
MSKVPDPAKKKLTVLVADDEHPLARMLSMMVSVMGYDTLVAHDGEEALQLARQHHPALILTDYMMPRLNGTELIAQIRFEAQRDHWQTPSTIILSCADQSILQNADADIIMQKPFEMADLDAAITQLLGTAI